MTGKQSKPWHPDRKHYRCSRRENLTMAPGREARNLQKTAHSWILTGTPERRRRVLQQKKTMEMKTWRPTCEKVAHLMTSSLNRKLVSKTASPPDAHLSDVRLDQPTSSQGECYEEVQPTEPSLQEVLVEATGSRPEENAIGEETPDSANIRDQEEPTIPEGEMQFDDTPEPDISMDEDWPALSSATIDCPASSEPTPIGRVSQEPPNERQRPAKIANRPTRYRDNSFETHFQPVPRRHCRKIQRQDSTGHNDINAEVRHELGRGVNHKNVASTGNENAEQKHPFRPGTSHHSRSIASFHPYPPMTC